MDDWLAELRESKRQAIERAQAGKARGLSPQERTAVQLQSQQDLLAALIKAVDVERSLQQFADEILQGHPLFSNMSVTRTVRSQAVGSAIELTEPAPWTAPVAGNPLPDQLDLGNGHYIIAMVWRLQSNYYSPHNNEIHSYRLRVSASASEVLFDGQRLTPQTPDAFKTRLTTTFKSALARFSQRRVRYHRHRPWYRRLWHIFF